LVQNGINHSNKSLQVCMLVMTQATGTLKQWNSNAINVKRWYFTSVVPNVASIQITLLSSNQSMALNCISVWIPMLKGTWIPTSRALEIKKHHLGEHILMIE
jgi:hypothetical protein